MPSSARLSMPKGDRGDLQRVEVARKPSNHRRMPCGTALDVKHVDFHPQREFWA